MLRQANLGDIGGSGLDHGLDVIFRRIGISKMVNELFAFDRTQLDIIGASAPKCLTPEDFRPLGEWMSRNLVIPNLVNILNATSLVLPFPDLGTVDQNNAIESESDEIKEICVNHYNASVLINPNQTSKRNLYQVILRGLQCSLLVQGQSLLKIKLPPGLDGQKLRRKCLSLIIRER